MTLAFFFPCARRIQSASGILWALGASNVGLPRSRSAASLLRGFFSSEQQHAEYPPHQALRMPSLSPTMDKGNLVSWKVKAGDVIRAGDVLADIETDKATLAFENQEDGVIAKILIPEGSKDVLVGTPVALFVDDVDQVAAFENYTPPSPPSSSSSSSSSSLTSVQEQAPPASSSPPPPPSVQANARLGPAARYLLNQAGLSMSDILTPSGPHSIITKGDVLAAIEAGVKPKQAISNAHTHSVPAEKSTPSAGPKATGNEAAPPKADLKSQAANVEVPFKAKPSVGQGLGQQAAGEGSGIQKKGKGPRFFDTPNSQIRKIIAQRLLESKVTIPSLYVTSEVSMDTLLDLRKSLADQGVKVSVNDCVLKAVALALKEVPDANVFWDKATSSNKPFTSIDISVAVATEKGLITPIVKAADKLSLSQISSAVKDLAGRAKANKLKPEEFQGGSFTVSNLGMFGLTTFSAIINPPQAAILAIGGSSNKTVLRNGKPSTVTVMSVGLSADHRVYDGELAAAFLSSFAKHIESPMNLIL